MTDDEIIKKILKGETEYYRPLVEKYQHMVFHTCIGFLHDKDEAEDLTQEIFIQAYQALNTFKSNASFSTWIYRIAVNASLNKIRTKKKNTWLLRLDSLRGENRSKTFEIPVPEKDNPENILFTEEYRTLVQKALDSLPDKQRTAIVLSKYDDLSQKEIAGIMNISEGAVEALIQRAKAGLRKKLSSLIKKSKG